MFVIDTNVCISANGRDTHAGVSCQLSCINFLQQIVSAGDSKVFLDEGGEILRQYRNYLNYEGSPGVGDLFYKYLHDNMWSGASVRVVGLSPISDDARGFEELPANQLDKSDRVFLALALVTGAAVVNALDTDWHEATELLEMLHVSVKQICPEHSCV